MPNEELLRAGIAAAKAGNLEAAAAIFARLVKADPASEQGWLWLGQCCPSREQSEYCFRRVLALNPNNPDARQRLEGLSNPAAATPAPYTPPPKPETTGAQKPAPPVSAPVSPFISYEGVDLSTEHPAAAPDSKPPFEPSALAKAKTYQDSDLPSFLQGVEQPVPPQPKRTSRLLAVFLWSLPICLILGLAVEYLYLSGIAARWIPAGLIPVSTSPPVLVQTPVQINSDTPQPLKPTSEAPTSTSSPTLAPTPLATIAYNPIWEDSPCNFPSPEGVVVTCGYVSVPEVRTDPHTRTIKLAVVVFHSSASNPAPDPVIFLQGGPGGQAVMLSADAYRLLVEPFLSKRDYVAFDQRGTGLSKPALGCEELATDYKRDIHGQLPASSRDMIYTNDFRSCHGSMSIGGINLNGYTTAESAEDIKDIATVLKYKQVNLYGASYGTRLALLTMRAHPEIVRSVVLDSVVPVEAKLYDSDPIRYGSSLQAMFDGCAADPGCNAVYPNLKADFWALVDQLDAKPVSVTAPLLTGGTITETVNGSDLIGVTVALLKSSSLISTVPESIYRIKAGDYSTFVAIQSSLPYEFEGIDIGLYISVMCHEHILATTPQDLQASMDSQHDIGRYFRLPFFGKAENLFNTCRVWGSQSPLASEIEPVVSDIPTLIIEGKYDPATPPIFGRQVAAHLKNSYYMEFPNQGHTPTATDQSNCAFGTMLSFFDHPTKIPDLTCLAKINGVSFLVPYTGDPPLELSTQNGYGFTSKAPASWKSLGFGIYYRDNSPLDITQLVILQTKYNSTELLDSLSSKLYGYQGFDAAPVEIGTRQANGLTWALYKTTSYGRPVDLAMADDPNGEALVVLLFCHKDEHDALYQTVYLPVIDSVVSNP
jgi:pimeloyl-ACP methyl ester carboxylesterase